jgi:hypothetical protein
MLILKPLGITRKEERVFLPRTNASKPLSHRQLEGISLESACSVTAVYMGLSY